MYIPSEAAMSFDVRVIDDLMRVATGALGTVAGLRDEAQARMRDRFERVLSRMDMVSREEFEVVRAMAAKAREENEALAGRIAALEAGIPRPAAKPAARRPRAAKAV
jgi:BMFP domain-containing protein YqiC